MTNPTQLSILLAATLALTGCPDVEKACTDDARASVTLTVVDETGTPIPDAVVAYAVDGGASEACESWAAGEFVCGMEESGDFVIDVDATGYAPTTVDLTVGADECHVIGEVLEVELLALNCTDEEIPSVQVNVVDDQGQSIPTADVVWNIASEDDAPEPCDPVGGGGWVCGYEVAGELQIDVSAAGFQPSSTLVTVTADECHVITELLDVVLQ